MSNRLADRKSEHMSTRMPERMTECQIECQKIGHDRISLGGDHSKKETARAHCMCLFACGPKTVLVKLTFLATSNYVFKFSSILQGVGCGGRLKSLLLTTSN